ncbi:MAG: FHA domain-containing protein [Chloroflexota bacterium]|nr:FHA domain-containing protein [Chloroflexota bacterium]
MTGQSYQLTMRSGPTPGKVFPLEQEEVRLGRDLASDISISDPEVSRHHARFFMQDENIFMEDLGSTNGSFLNGQRISNPQQLRQGDVITFGEKIVMVFEKTIYDRDATVVSSQSPRTVQAQFQEAQPVQEAYQPEPEPAVYQQPQHLPRIPGESGAQPQMQRSPAKKTSGLPAWLIILIIAIVVIACVIAVTLWFMPASWWCAITFDTLEGCPLP